MRVTPDIGVIGVIAATCGLSSVVVLLPSYLYIRRGDFAGLSGARTTVFSASPSRRTLLGVQVAASVVLMFCAALFVGSLRAITSLDPGYDVQGLSWARLERRPGLRPDSQPAIYLRQLIDSVSSQAGTSQIAFALRFPTVGTTVPSAPVSHVADPSDSATTDAWFDLVSPEFFTVLGIRLVQGRAFNWLDTATQPNVAIINVRLARTLFADEAALGQRIRLGPPPNGRVATIVGIVGDATPGDVRLVRKSVIYMPLIQQPLFTASPNIVVRGSGELDFAEKLRIGVGDLGRHYVTSLTTAEEQFDRFLVSETMLVQLSSTFALVGLFVTALGLYALLAYDITCRTRELGIRLALGANRRQLLSSLSGNVFSPILLGVAAGIPLAFGSGYAAQHLLFGISPTSTPALVLSVTVILTVGLLACLNPAARAAATDIVRSLRYE